MKNNFCVIMAGGVGSRFWPLSRTSKPKQFIDIIGTGKSLLQQTFDRFINICPIENIYIVTVKIYKELVLEQLPNIHENQILCEPFRRNTAPCIAYANYKIRQINPKANIIVAPSDHLILNEQEFIKVIKEGLDFVAGKEKLLTLGIKPHRPDTGYGYIQINKNEESADKNINKVKTFTEKPNLELAKVFLDSKEFLWNSGIFIWSLTSIESAFKKYLPAISSLFNPDNVHDSNENKFIEDIFSKCKDVSIDYGVMEKAQNVYVYSADFGWSDLGTWGALYENSNLDDNGNTIKGENVLTYDLKNCIVNFQNEKLVVLQGLEDYIVTESNDMLLISKKDAEQNIRQIVNDIKIHKGEEYI